MGFNHFSYSVKKIYSSGKHCKELYTMTEKLTEIYTLRLSDLLKLHIDKLTSEQKHILNQRIRNEMARVIHEFKFNPRDYQEEE